ncbi:hypothetical protein E4U53_004789, partial [Claviceps sorghi]
MDPSGHGKRDVAETGPLSMGAVLAIALCGGVVLFTSLGLVMACVVKRRQGRSSARVYTIPDAYSQTRLTKRPVMMSESGLSGLSSRFSSRFSLTLPPIVPLPPMPSYSSFSFFRTPSRRRRRRSWRGEGAERQSWGGDDDFADRGGTRRGEGAETWFSRDSWLLGQAAGVARGSASDDGMKPAPLRVQRPPQPHYEEYRRRQQEAYGRYHGPQPQPQPQPDEEQMRWDGGLTMPGGAEAEARDDAARGRPPAVRGPAQAHVRPSMTMTDVGLRDILRSTDQRLREGASRSPCKKTHLREASTATAGTPVRTPQSRRSSVSRCAARQSRSTPAPTPTPTLTPTPSPRKPIGAVTISPTRGSVASAGSAANSLIAEATERLQLPGGMASPSRLHERERVPESALHTPSTSPERGGPRPPRDAKQTGAERRISAGSDQSSSLSTLYSVGEPEREEEEKEKEEEEKQAAQRFVRHAQDDDPFVEAGPVPRPSTSPSRPAARDKKASPVAPP